MLVVAGDAGMFGAAIDDDDAPAQCVYVVAWTTATMLPTAYNILVSALLPVVACLEHLLVSVYPGVIWHGECLCGSCLARGMFLNVDECQIHFQL